MEWGIQSDHIAIDGNEAWLVDRNENALYKADLSKDECDLVSMVPTPFSIDKDPLPFYRINSYCYKKESCIFLMPDRGESILIYDLDKKKISKIEINNPLSVRLSIHDFWEENGKLWAVSHGLGKILLIDINKKTIAEYYDIFDNPNILPGHEAKKVGNCIFNVSRNSNMICEFNIASREKKNYEIHGLTEGMYTICYDNTNFWLSGISGKIYLWDKEKKKITELNEYPKDLKIYKEEVGKIEEIGFPLEQEIPIFYKSFLLGKFVCFLPLNSNQALCNKLLCVNREDFHMISIALNEEKDNTTGLYTLEYIKENRIAGILCERNNLISEFGVNLNIIKKKFLKKKDQTALMQKNIALYGMNIEATNLALKEYRKAIQDFEEIELEKKYDFGKLIFDKMEKK